MKYMPAYFSNKLQSSSTFPVSSVVNNNLISQDQLMEIRLRHILLDFIKQGYHYLIPMYINTLPAASRPIIQRLGYIGSSDCTCH